MPLNLNRAALDAAAAKYGRSITYIGNVERHNRNGAGPWDGARCVTVHHTASGACTAAQRDILLRGRAGLPGPLVQFGVTREGTIDCYSLGRSNHLGKVDADVLNAVVNQAYQSRPPRPGRDTVDGNRCAAGIEPMHPGTSPLTGAIYDAVIDLCCILIDLGAEWDERSVAGHKEFTRRKIDPLNDMAEVRADIAKRRAEAHATPAPAAPAPKTMSKTQVVVQSTIAPDSANAEFVKRMKAGPISVSNLRAGVTHEDVYQYKVVLRAAHGPAYRASLLARFRSACWGRTYDAMAAQATRDLYLWLAKTDDPSWGVGDLTTPGPRLLARLGFASVEA